MIQLLRIELYKIFKRPRTYISFGIVTAITFVIQLAMLTEQKSFKGHLNALSIIDDYLEHARVFVFGNEKNPQVFISSADWMVRNLDHRVEVACPVYDKEIQAELIEILNIQLAENVKGRILDNEQSNNYVQRQENMPEVRSQEAIYKYLSNKQYKL